MIFKDDRIRIISDPPMFDDELNTYIGFWRDELISKLESWSAESSSFHLDRQLSDEVLIADGWNCEADSTFSGGFRWWIGSNPEISTGENRPHVINDLNAALGVIPFDATFKVVGNFSVSEFEAIVAGVGKGPYYGTSSRATVAILIAALKFKRETDK